MSSGRIYQGNGRIYGPSLTAALMDDKPTEATPCITYQLSPEEREKYKPVPRKEKKQ